MTVTDDMPVPAHQHSGGENLEVMLEAENYNNYLRSLVARYAGSASSALDFGAGIGTFSDSPGLSPGMIQCVEPDESARQALAARGFPVHASLESIEENSIDYAFSLNVLEHIEDDAAALQALHARLRPGGCLFIYVPAFMSLYTSMDSHVGHCRRYRLGELKKRLTDAGFSIASSGYADALGFFATLFLKLFDGDEPAPLNPRLVRWYDRIVFPVSRLLSVLLRPIVGKNAWAVALKRDREGI